MWLNLWRIATRQLFASPRTVVLTVAGTSLSVAVFIFTAAMMNGLVIFFSDRLLRISPTLTILPQKEEWPLRAKRPTYEVQELVIFTNTAPPDDRPTIRGGLSLIPSLRRLQGVEGVSPMVSTAAVLSFGTISESVTLLGLDPRLEKTVTDIFRLVVEGSWENLESRGDGVIVGFKLAERLGVAVGDRLVASGENGAQKDLEVVGILAVGLGNWDESTAVVNYPVAQGLAGWSSDEVSELRLRTPLDKLGFLRTEVQNLVGRRVERWEETNRSALQLFRTIAATTYLLTGFVLLVGGLGISNKLATVILDKERDIAILRAYGFSQGTVRRLFFLQGVALGILGSAFGCLFAFFTISYFKANPVRFAPREKAVLAYTELYLANEPLYYLIVSVAALLIAIFASLLAVRRAVRVLPVEVLRGRE